MPRLDVFSPTKTIFITRFGKAQVFSMDSEREIPLLRLSFTWLNILPLSLENSVLKISKALSIFMPEFISRLSSLNKIYKSSFLNFLLKSRELEDSIFSSIFIGLSPSLFNFSLASLMLVASMLPLTFSLPLKALYL